MREGQPRQTVPVAEVVPNGYDGVCVNRSEPQLLPIRLGNGVRGMPRTPNAGLAIARLAGGGPWISVVALAGPTELLGRPHPPR